MKPRLCYSCLRPLLNGPDCVCLEKGLRIVGKHQVRLCFGEEARIGLDGAQDTAPFDPSCYHVVGWVEDKEKRAPVVLPHDAKIYQRCGVL